MTARQLISDLIIPLDAEDSAAIALGLMDEFHVTHLPIIRNQEYLGLISDADIFSMNSFEEPVGKHPLTLNRVCIHEEQHFFDVVRMFSDLKLTLLPVITAKNTYLGAITLKELTGAFASTAAVTNPGGIIILEINDKDYVLTEVARILEDNDAKLLGMYITTFPDSTKLEVTLKVNRIDLAPLVQTFLRFNYTVKATFSEQSEDERLRERYDSLMKYLNV